MARMSSKSSGVNLGSDIHVLLHSSLEYLQAVAEDVMASVTPESTNGLFLNVALGLISVQTE